MRPIADKYREGKLKRQNGLLNVTPLLLDSNIHVGCVQLHPPLLLVSNIHVGCAQLHSPLRVA